MSGRHTHTLKQLISEGSAYRSLYDNHPEAIYIMDTQGMYVDANRSNERITGYSREEFINLPQDALFFKEDFLNRNINIRKALLGHSPTFEMQIKNKQRELRDVRVTYVPIKVNEEIVGLYGIAQDITDQKRTEEYLRDRERKLRIITEHSLNIIAIHEVSEDFKYTFISPSCTLLLGYSSDEMMGKSPFDYIHSEDIPKVHEHLKLIQEGKKPLNAPVSARVRHKDGHYIWIEGSGMFTYDDKGKASRIVSIARDITDQQEGRNRLEESEQRYKSLVKYNPSGVYSLDMEGNFLSINKQFEELTGYKEEELLTGFFHGILLSGELEHAIKYFELAKQGKPQSYEGRIMRKDGEECRVHITNVPIVVNEKVVGVYGIVIDITDQRRYFEQIKTLSSRHSMILRSVTDGIFGLNTEGEVIFINPAGADILGYSEDEFLGLKTHETIHYTHPNGSPNDISDCPIHKTIKDGKVRHVHEDIFWKKDGSSFLASYQVNPIYDHGKIVGAVVVFSDITSEREIIRAKEHAEQIAEDKSHFLNMMSHEIRTPMSGMIGMADLLLESELTEEQRKYADILKTSSECLLTILNDILDLSKMEAGKMDLNLDVFDLSDLVHVIKELFSPQALKKGLRFSAEIKEDVPNCIVADSNRLRQVLINLVGNAIKFTKHGEVKLTISTVESERSGLSLEFAVSDTGIGIPKAKMDQLFKSFSQIHSNNFEKYGSTGLGLKICKQLVELMGSSISAESEEGKGSTFKFILPIETASSLKNIQ